VDIAEAELARGEGCIFTKESMRQLSEAARAWLILGELFGWFRDLRRKQFSTEELIVNRS
jgi:hypothetical protein